MIRLRNYTNISDLTSLEALPSQSLCEVSEVKAQRNDVVLIEQV